jgi:hypothetical protein
MDCALFPLGKGRRSQCTCCWKNQGSPSLAGLQTSKGLGSCKKRESPPAKELHLSSSIHPTPKGINTGVKLPLKRRVEKGYRLSRTMRDVRGNTQEQIIIITERVTIVIIKVAAM